MPDTSINDLFIEIKRETGTKLTEDQFSEVVRNLWRSRLVEVTKDQKVRAVFSDTSPAGPDETNTKRSLHIWIPSGGNYETQYSKHKDKFEAWLTQNNA
jgi:hypothetical protein